MNNKKSRNINLLVVMLMAAMLNAGCFSIRNPFRDYSEKDFNSADWKKGDAIDRGNMFPDLLRNQRRHIYKKTEAQILELLGEPDVKKEENGRTVWGYKVELGYESDIKYFSVSFKDGVAGMFGM